MGAGKVLPSWVPGQNDRLTSGVGAALRRRNVLRGVAGSTAGVPDCESNGRAPVGTGRARFVTLEVRRPGRMPGRVGRMARVVQVHGRRGTARKVKKPA